MKTFKNLLVALLVLLSPALPCLAQVDLDNPVASQGIRLFRDVQNPDVLYYPPTGIGLASDRDGNPDFKLAMMRYTGRKLTRDQQKKAFRNLCQLKITTRLPGPEQLASLRAAFPGIAFKMLPLFRSESFLVYTPIAAADSQRVLQGITAVSADEQTFTVRLSEADAQLLEAAILKKQALMSVCYAFFAEGTSVSDSIQQVQATTAPGFASFLQNYTDSLSKTTGKKIVPVVTGSLAVQLAGTPGNYVKKIDLNEQLPAEYASVDVRCYDFNNGLREDLYAKKVELRAFATDGRPIECQATFYKHAPETVSVTVNFDFAVRVDLPLRFRITEIYNDSRTLVKGWVSLDGWGMVDVTGR